MERKISSMRVNMINSVEALEAKGEEISPKSEKKEMTIGEKKIWGLIFDRQKF